ncbi:hypothetical protein [Dokdonella sp.]|uniref:hypothetical protein n=1 Tax=Dokdonella sp. TaxID=2291710 RepID=UPI0037841249
MTIRTRLERLEAQRDGDGVVIRAQRPNETHAEALERVRARYSERARLTLPPPGDGDDFAKHVDEFV